MSRNPFDWLGHGMYFWENNYDRAMEWAERNSVKYGYANEPAVVGAVIELHYCCDLLDNSFLKVLRGCYDLMQQEYRLIGRVLPKNKDSANDPNGDKLMRFLDCATIEFMHRIFRNKVEDQIFSGGYAVAKPFDSVRGVFLEGGEAYPGAGISAKSHIQLCIRNPNCIKGFFQKREEIDFIRQEVLQDPPK